MVRRCRELAEPADDAEVAGALRAAASDMEAAMTILQRSEEEWAINLGLDQSTISSH
jgi:hypothetical protein